MGIKSTKGVLATLLTLLVITLAPQPAAAAPAPPGTGLPSGEVVCFLEFRHGILVGERCISFRPIWPDCIKCDAIAVDYGIDPWVHDIFVDGFVLLDKAAQATDPGVQATYRKQAQNNFTAVAVALRGDVDIDTGFVDRGSGKFTSEPRQNLIEAGAAINAGLGLLRLANIDPDGDPAVRGMQDLERAYESMARGG